MTHKFIDDTTVTEVIKKRQASQIESAVDELISWSSDNRMNVNTRKTKEMVLGPLARNPPQPTVQCAGSDSQPVTEMERTRTRTSALS